MADIIGSDWTETNHDGKFIGEWIGSSGTELGYKEQFVIATNNDNYYLLEKSR